MPASREVITLKNTLSTLGALLEKQIDYIETYQDFLRQHPYLFDTALTQAIGIHLNAVNKIILRS